MPRFIGARCGVKRIWHAPADDLLDLGRVPVVEQPVGGEVLVDACRTASVLQRPAGAGDPGDASTITPVRSTSPAATSGASASVAAVT